MPKEQNLEIKVGTFVLIAVICLTFFVISLSDVSFFKKGRTYFASFQFANGLKESAPVRFAGVDAGLVKDIDIVKDDGKQKVKVEIFLNDDMPLPEDSEVFINQLGLLGEKYVEIMPGESSIDLEEGSLLIGEDPVAMENITKSVGKLATKFEVMMDEIQRDLFNQENKKNISEMLAGTNTFMKKMNNILTPENEKAVSGIFIHLSSVVKKIDQGEGTLGRFMTDSRMYDNLEEMTADLKENPWKLFYRPKGKKK